jgi:cyclopropane fatty-acyl-phospholipid synthase-like methyltransferase
LPTLSWQTSDLVVNHSAINQWIDDFPAPNIIRPISIDLSQAILSTEKFDAIYTANTLHIISWELVQNFFELVKVHLTIGGILCIYGPFNYDGRFTSESNANFELWLKDRDKVSGIRDFEAVCQLASQAGLSLTQDIEMPANNRLLVFKK